MTGAPPVGLAVVVGGVVGGVVATEVPLEKLALTVRPLSFIGGR